MVAKTRGKKQRSKRTTQKRNISTQKREISTLRNANAFNKQRGGDDFAIEGIVEDIKTLTTKIAKAKYTDGTSFKKNMIDPFYPIVSSFDQHIVNEITKKDLMALSKSLETFLETIEKNKPKLTQFYPSFYLEVIPREISRMLETIRAKMESMPTIVVKPTIVKKNKTEQREALKREAEELEALKRESEVLEALKREAEELEALKMESEALEALKREEETLFMDFENTRSNKVAEFEKMVREKRIRLEKLQAERKEKENKIEKDNNRKQDSIQQFTDQFNNEIAQLFNAFTDIFEKQLELLQDSKKLVSIVKEIYPNVLNYTDKIQNQNKDDKFLYKYYSFYLLIFIGMLNRFLKTRVPELKLVIKGGKAAQMILSPNPTLDLKSDDIDVLVQHPDQLYAKIFSQHFVSFFGEKTRDSERVSVLLENPTNPHVLKIYYINQDNNRLVISDIDSKPLPNPELFDIIETTKSKDIDIVDADEVETTYLFRLTYYHQTRESFINEKKYYRDMYSNLPPSDINSRFAEKASRYVSVMEPSPEKYETFMPPSPPK